MLKIMAGLGIAIFVVFVLLVALLLYDHHLATKYRRNFQPSP